MSETKYWYNDFLVTKIVIFMYVTTFSITTTTNNFRYGTYPRVNTEWVQRFQNTGEEYSIVIYK